MAPTLTNIVSDRKLAQSLAVRFVPEIYQEYGSVFDLISPVQLGQIDDVIKDFEVITSKPTLYYGAREDRSYWYIYYMVYHPWDVSFFSWKIIRKLDSHRHDTEGILLKIDKKSEVADMITVCHYRFLCEKQSNRKVVIEKEGHGIRPYSQRGPSGNFMVYRDFAFEDLNAMSSSDWEKMRRKLNGVSMPDEQCDSSLRDGPSGRRHNKPGDIFLAPDVLCKTLKLRGAL